MYDDEKGDIHMEIPGVGLSAPSCTLLPAPTSMRPHPPLPCSPPLHSSVKHSCPSPTLRAPILPQRQEEENVGSESVRPVQPFDAEWTPKPGEVRDPTATPRPFTV